MAAYNIKSHAVTGLRIQKVEPLIARGQMLGPDSGLTLILDDGSSQKWIAERDADVPTVGDFLITDADLKLTYVVTAAKFADLYEV